jgi:hypothetical protein
MTYDGKDLYPTIIDKIAVITYSLINNHGFVDGNKRIGIFITSQKIPCKFYAGLRDWKWKGFFLNQHS